MKALSARGTAEYGFQHRILITGTPLQNNMDELWTLLNFIDPDEFENQQDFDMEFGNLQNKDSVEALQSTISPYMLRRVKEDVAKDIPSKEETVIDVELTSVQKAYYRAIFENNHQYLASKCGAKVAKLMNVQMELRKCCNHPYLLDGVEEAEGLTKQKELLKNDEEIDREELKNTVLEHGLIMTSGKMVLLDKLLPKLRDEGHKILIFSQMVRMIDVISDYCEFRGFNYEVLDGRVNGSERQKSIDRFNTEQDSFLFLLSTRAGGVGINLTAADIVIIFDSDWNPQNDVQAQARCHRIGQTKDVMIYRLVTARSFEQEMFDRASKKLGLEQAVLGTFQVEDNDGKPSASEMAKLLKQGAYALMSEDNDDIGSQFCADDIDTILTKRTRTRVVEGAKTNSWLNKAGHSVSRSGFTADSSQGAQVDVDDPEFWSKVMPGFCTVDILVNKLKELEKDMKMEKNARDMQEEKEEKEREKQRMIEEGIDVSEDGNEAKKVEEGEDAAPKRGVGRPKGGAVSRARADSSDEEDEDGNCIDNRSEMVKKRAALFMEDLGKVIADTLAEDEAGTLDSNDKESASNLVMKVSVKRKLFCEAERLIASGHLQSLQGERRRRCRDSTETTGDFESSAKKRKSGKPRVGPDGYLHHDSSGEEEEWSNTNRKGYGQTDFLSKSEANRRFKPLFSGMDEKSKMAKTWPNISRDLNGKVMSRVLDLIIKEDTQRTGGAFSLDVDLNEYPDYLEIIAKPMNYKMMQMAAYSYRSPAGMQKDFRLILSNCITYNGSKSPVVMECTRQYLRIMDLFVESCLFFGIFLTKSGNTIEVFSDDELVAEEKSEEESSEDDDEFVDDIKKAAKGSRGNKGGTRMVRCRKCTACLAKDCGKCNACLDKPKFGGPGKMKQCCKKRICNSKVLGGTTGKRADAAERRKRRAENGGGADGEGGDRKRRERRPRSRSRQPGRRKRRGIDRTDVIDQKLVPDVEKRGEDDKDDSSFRFMLVPMDVDLSGEVAAMFDLAKVAEQQRQMQLDYVVLSGWVNQLGRWKCPDVLASTFGAFDAIARLIIEKIKLVDYEEIIWRDVTDQDVPGYSEVIQRPMSLDSIAKKLIDGKYSPSNDVAFGELFDDIMTIFSNCFLYNIEESEVCKHALGILVRVPEIFASACLSKTGEKLTEVNASEVGQSLGRGGKELINMKNFEKFGRLVVVSGGDGGGATSSGAPAPAGAAVGDESNAAAAADGGHGIVTVKEEGGQGQPQQQQQQQQQQQPSGVVVESAAGSEGVNPTGANGASNASSLVPTTSQPASSVGGLPLPLPPPSIPVSGALPGTSQPYLPIAPMASSSSSSSSAVVPPGVGVVSGYGWRSRLGDNVDAAAAAAGAAGAAAASGSGNGNLGQACGLQGSVSLAPPKSPSDGKRASRSSRSAPAAAMLQRFEEGKVRGVVVGNAKSWMVVFIGGMELKIRPGNLKILA